MSFLPNLKNPRDEVCRVFDRFTNPLPDATGWAVALATEQELDPVTQQVQLIREIRLAEPKLDLKAAKFLASEAAKSVR